MNMDAKMVEGNLAQFKKCIEKVYYFRKFTTTKTRKNSRSILIIFEKNFTLYIYIISPFTYMYIWPICIYMKISCETTPLNLTGAGNG